jgi:predicted ArsR family transcriptional regulator
MDLTAPVSEDDVLAAPVRARLFEALAALRRPAGTDELAATVGRHPNSVRVQLRRLADAGLLECRTEQRARGRPRHLWAILPDARPGGRPPDAHAELSRWLARAMRRGHRLADVEAAGREIGRELAPAAGGRDIREAMQDALTALGFAPQGEPAGEGRWRYVLGNCPYRSAVAENPALVCSLHRGLTAGLIDELDPAHALEGFVARDPFEAGCLIEMAQAVPSR